MSYFVGALSAIDIQTACLIEWNSHPQLEFFQLGSQLLDKSMEGHIEDDISLAIPGARTPGCMAQGRLQKLRTKCR